MSPRDEGSCAGDAAVEEDARLVERLLAGDEAVFLKLVREQHSGMLRMARSLVGNAAVAEEVVQETWAGVLAGLRAFERRASLRTWIYRILYKRALTRREREKRSVAFSAVSSGPESEESELLLDPARFDAHGHWNSFPRPWNEDTPDRIVESEELRNVIKKAIDGLPANLAAVVTLRDLQGWDSEEVCKALEISEGNQRVLLHRARTRIRSVVEEYLDVTALS